jgi:hypothetical protein
MNETTARQTLLAVRRQFYDQALGLRKDTLFALMEAPLVSPGPRTLVHLSLAPTFQRQWPSAPDALADGSLDQDQCRRLIHAYLPDQLVHRRVVWAIDGTTWPRPAARTSAQRTFCHRTSAGIPQSGIVPGWEYQWLVAVPDVPEAAGSWVLPLDIRRRSPTAGTPTALALAQIRTALAYRPPGDARPVVTLDSSYDAIELAQAVQSADPKVRIAADVLVRLSSRRRFYRPPPPYSGRGPHPKHGPVFRLHQPATHGTPDHTAVGADPRHGQVRVDVWEALHAQWAATTPFTLVRVQVAHLPKAGRTPKPLWLVWTGAELPADLLDLWHSYAQRFTVEHGFRFAKHDLGWTTVRPGRPEAADRWSWLIALAFWELWLLRTLVADQRLPWERPLAPAQLTPGRVRRACAGILSSLGTPTRPVRRRGKSPGRQLGQCPGPRQPSPVVRRTPQPVPSRRQAVA